MDRPFEGKSALITGATSGIGLATAVHLAAKGAHVALNHLPDTDPSVALERIREVEGSGFSVPCDVRNPAQVVHMFEEVADRSGKLDWVVSNAAINPPLRWHETTIEDFDRLSETIFRGTWIVATEGAKQMIKFGNGGAIVCISSISAHVGSPTQVAYCGAKGAVSMLAKALGACLGEHGIRVNAVEPGLVRTPLAAELFTDLAGMKYYNDRIALHRAAEPAEIARVIAFLLSEEAGYVTASAMLVDGGFLANAEL